MTRRKTSRKFRNEAARLVTDRGVAGAKAACDVEMVENVLRRRMSELTPGAATRARLADATVDFAAQIALVTTALIAVFNLNRTWLSTAADQGRIDDHDVKEHLWSSRQSNLSQLIQQLRVPFGVGARSEL